MNTKQSCCATCYDDDENAPPCCDKSCECHSKQSWEDGFDRIYNVSFPPGMEVHTLDGDSRSMRERMKDFIREIIASERASAYEQGYAEDKSSSVADLSALLDEDEQLVVERIRKEERETLVSRTEGMMNSVRGTVEQKNGFYAACNEFLALLKGTKQ